MEGAHFILFVHDQAVASGFYSRVLAARPTLDVPNMTEFTLPGGAILGLMPAAAIQRLLGEALPNPAAAAGTPRSELYLVVDDPESFHQRALRSGARELSPLAPRGWGHVAAYSLDLDSHVLAFARPATATATDATMAAAAAERKNVEAP